MRMWDVLRPSKRNALYGINSVVRSMIGLMTAGELTKTEDFKRALQAMKVAGYKTLLWVLGGMKVAVRK